jgi:hypothetical protein
MREYGEELPQGAFQDRSPHPREGPFLHLQVGRRQAPETQYVPSLSLSLRSTLSLSDSLILITSSPVRPNFVFSLDGFALIIDDVC